MLLFGVPASPLAQPWSINGGNTVAALIGVTAFHLIGSPLIAAAAAAGCAFAAMALLRCIHPPGGAVALTAVLGGPHITSLGYEFVLLPVLLNSLLMTLVAVIYNNATRHSYPHQAHLPAHPHPPLVNFTLAPGELDEVLADYGEAVDISRDDLEALFQELAGRVQRRGLDKMPAP